MLKQKPGVAVTCTAVALAIVFVLSFALTTFAFGGFSAPTDGEWYNISWQYRQRIEINTTASNVTNWPIEMIVNFTDLMPGGTFDNNSIRLVEYNLTGKIMYEVPVQFDKDSGYNNATNAYGEIIFITNGTTQANARRIFYLYFDTVENGAKPFKSYSTNLSYSWSGTEARVNTSRLDVRIDTNRGENTSGIYYVEEKPGGVPIIIGNSGERTAEYIEFSNGTTNTTFDLNGNATFITGPVRLTILQQGQEVVFGGQKTWKGTVIKKYYFYNRAGPQTQGAFIKISNEFISNGTVNRSSNNGVVALDLQRTFLSQDMNAPSNSSTDPYSWVVTSDSGGSVAGIININETTPNYFASFSSTLGRIGISLTNTTVSTSIKQTSLVYFATGAAAGVSEFLAVRNGTTNAPIIKTNLTEKLITSVKSDINSSVYNLNETILILANISQGDPYNLIAKINATLDLGTVSTTDDVVLRLFDDGTNGDLFSGDKIFTGNYTFAINSSLTEWKINMTAYTNASEYLNSTIFAFNVTNQYFVNITIINAIGIVSRQVFANVTINNFNRTEGISGAGLNCSFSGVEIFNKTDNGNGIYSINFTAPAVIGSFSLFCNTTKYNNTGNDTKTFTTENPKTTVAVNITPSSFSLSTVALFNNATFEFFTNATNVGNGTAKITNLTVHVLLGWTANITFETCGDISVNASCIRWFSITVPANTTPGNYTANITVAWTNPDDTENSTRTNISVYVNPNPRINVTQIVINGTGADGTQKQVGVFNVLSIGNYLVNSTTFSCAGGVACQDFNMSFSPPNITDEAVGSNVTVSVIAAVPLNYTPGIYNGTINITSDNNSFSLNIYVYVQNATRLIVSTNPQNIVITGISVFTGASFYVDTNISNIDNSSARNTTVNFTLPVNWTINSSYEICGTITYASNCMKNNTFTVPNSTSAGNYSINITVRWIDNGNTNGTIIHVLNVTVAESPVIIFDNSTKFGYAPDGVKTNPFNLTVLSVGASSANGISFNCTSGVVCANFSPTFTPSTVSTLAAGTNATIKINVTVPTMFHAGNYTGTLNVSSTNAQNKTVTLIIEVLANRTWDMVPLSCRRSMFPDVGKVCDVNITNIGNALMNFTIINTVQNFTFSNITNFTVDQYENYTFSILYNVSGVPQFIYNSTFVITSLDTAAPQNMTLNISLLPSTPPRINLTFDTLIEQQSPLVIYANITDMTNTGIQFVNITVFRVNGTTDDSNLTLVSTNGNQSLWTITYAPSINSTPGNTTLRGVYNISVQASDNLGNVGNTSGNFTVRKKVSITSNTLSQQYVQGDTGTIYYSSRDVSNNGVSGVNVSFWIFDSNMSIIYLSTKTTDTLGSFIPLPTFSFASDASVGNYTLVSNSTFTDESSGITYTVTKNYTVVLSAKTVVVTGLFADIETAVVWFPNNVMRFNTLVYDGEGRPVDPDIMYLTVYDPAQNTYFITNLSSMTKKGTGFYSYSFAMPPSTATGMYLAVVNVTRNSLSTLKLSAFRVAQGGPYDVRLTLLKSEVAAGSPLDFVLTIENKGEVTQDVFVNYTITSMATGINYYFASEAVLTPAFTNQSFTRSAFVFSNQPLGNYVLRANVKYDNTQPEINASASFIVLAARTIPTPPPPSGGGGGGTGQGLTGEIAAEPESINSITIEKYSKDIRVYPGFKKIEYVIVRNSGKTVLNDIFLNIIGLPVSWYNVTPVSYKELILGNSSVFLVEYKIPKDASVGDYKFNFVATASTASDQKNAVLHVVGSLQDLILTDIAQLKQDLKDLLIAIGVAKNQGKSVDDVLLLADEVQQYINKAEINYNLNNTQDALDNIRDARVVLEKARDMLSKLQVVVSAAADYTFLLIVIVVPVIIIVVIFVLKKKNKMPKNIQNIGNFVGIIDKMRAGKTDTNSFSKDREKLTRMIVILDREKSENIISDAAYKEMKNSIENKLQKINKKMNV